MNPAPGGADPFGLWDSVVALPAQPQEALAFGLPPAAGEEAGPPPQEGVVWRVCGEEDLAARARRVRAVQQGLAAAEARLAGVLQRPPSGGDEQVSFSVPAALPPDSPEGRLLGALQSAAAAQEGGAVSFGLLDNLPGGPDWQDLQSRLGNLLQTVNRQLFNFAWVDTEMGGVLLARTTIRWSGDMTNLWLRQATPEQITLHSRSLAVAVESRQTNLRVITSVAGMASSLALAFTTPLGPARLMALAWQFISEVLVPFLRSDSAS